MRRTVLIVGAIVAAAVSTASAGNVTKVVAPDGGPYDNFGEEIATDGKHVIVGASRYPQQGGHAYIYPVDASGLGAPIVLVPSGLTKGDFFGSDVGIDGDRAIVGARNHDPVDSKLQNNKYGGAYFFKRSGGGWTQEAFVQASDRQLNQEFGGAVAISGDTAVVGAVFTKVGDNHNQGQAYVFTHKDGSWKETQILAATDGRNSDHFGWAVDVDGDHLFVSGVEHHGGPYDHPIGAVWVYERSGDKWEFRTKLQPSDLEDGNNFGSSIDISGDVAIVGAHLAHGADTGSGTAYVFRHGPGGWKQEARLMARAGAMSDDFGYRVAIDGDRALIGAWLAYVGDTMQQGKAFVFEKTASGWAETAMLTASDGGYEDQFGSAVAIGPGPIIVGASGDEGVKGADDSGALYVIEGVFDP